MVFGAGYLLTFAGYFLGVMHERSYQRWKDKQRPSVGTPAAGVRRRCYCLDPKCPDFAAPMEWQWQPTSEPPPRGRGECSCGGPKPWKNRAGQWYCLRCGKMFAAPAAAAGEGE